MTAPLLWFCAPPSGGRAGFASLLADAARAMGLRAEDRSLTLIRSHLAVRPRSEEEAQQNTIRAFWGLLLEERPELIVDLSPIPSALIANARKQGIRTAFWLLENALDPAYAYWREAAGDYDRFFSIQAEAFDPRVEYLPWGATRLAEPAEPVAELLLHGVASPHRIAFLRSFLEAWDENATLHVVGPGWSMANLPGSVQVDDRRTSPDETTKLMNGRIVLVPLSAPVNAVAPRVWDSIASGATVIVERTPALERHFAPGEILSFSTPAEAADEALSLVRDPHRRSSLTRIAREVVGDRNMLSHRIASILEPT